MDYPNRLRRLKTHDYAENGAYFITICSDYKRHLFGKIETPVVRGLAPAVTLTAYGEIIWDEIKKIPQKYPSISVDIFIVMPNHVHLLLSVANEKAGASPRTTVTSVIGALKSKSTIKCRKAGLETKLWQPGFYDHVIRTREDYEAAWNYIDGNPQKWLDGKGEDY